MNGYEAIIHFTDAGFKFLAKTLWPASFVAACYFLYLSVDAIAGKTTTANVIANVVADWGLDKIIPYLVGGSGVAYGVYERRLRTRTIKTLRDQAGRYEALAEPNRTGSGLLPGGDMPKDT